MSDHTLNPPQTRSDYRKAPTREDLHEMRNWMLAAQLSLSEVKDQMEVNGLNLDSVNSVEHALKETIALLKPY